MVFVNRLPDQHSCRGLQHARRGVVHAIPQGHFHRNRPKARADVLLLGRQHILYALKIGAVGAVLRNVRHWRGRGWRGILRGPGFVRYKVPLRDSLPQRELRLPLAEIDDFETVGQFDFHWALTYSKTPASRVRQLVCSGGIGSPDTTNSSPTVVPSASKNLFK